MADAAIDAAASAVPVTIIAGFLGAGKSTLLSYILRERHGERIAVLLNEFGASGDIERLSIQSATITGNEAPLPTDDWVQLENGCLCCTVKDAAVVAIERLMARRGAFEKIVVETSGVADPGALINMFWGDFATNGGTIFDGVVTLVDCHALDPATNARHPPELYQQLAHASVVLLNKTDVVPALQRTSKLAAIRAFIRSINPTATMHETVYAQ